MDGNQDGLQQRRGEGDESDRVALAAALRLAARFGFHEGICNHFSLAVSTAGDRYLINPLGLHWAEICASDLLLADESGRVLEGHGEVERTAFCIHSATHRARPDARCVLHTHMPYATALTSLADGRVETVNQNSLRFHGRIAYDDDYQGVADGVVEGERLAAALGEATVLFMVHHGVTVVGPSVAQTFDDLYYLERICENQVLAMSTGRPLKTISAAMADHAAGQIATERRQAHRHFAALIRILDREEPEFRK